MLLQLPLIHPEVTPVPLAVTEWVRYNTSRRYLFATSTLSLKFGFLFQVSVGFWDFRSDLVPSSAVVELVLCSAFLMASLALNQCRRVSSAPNLLPQITSSQHYNPSIVFFCSQLQPSTLLEFFIQRWQDRNAWCGHENQSQEVGSERKSEKEEVQGEILAHQEE